MVLITEAQSSAIVTHELAFAAVRDAFIAAISPGASSFSVVFGHGSDPQNRFTIKSASGAELAGLKVGAYFLTNDAHGLPRHASTILLIDQSNGRIGAVVEGSVVNGYRTAGADAVATDALARLDADVLTLFGTGHQAAYDVQAIARIRKLSRVLAVGREPSRANAFIRKLHSKGLPAEAAPAEGRCPRSGHYCHGHDRHRASIQGGLGPAGNAYLFQGIRRAGKTGTPKRPLPNSAAVLRSPGAIGAHRRVSACAVGQVLAGDAPGRVDDSQITVFDSSGISLQDLHMAKAILDRHTARTAVA